MIQRLEYTRHPFLLKTCIFYSTNIKDYKEYNFHSEIIIRYLNIKNLPIISNKELQRRFVKTKIPMIIQFAWFFFTFSPLPFHSCEVFPCSAVPEDHCSLDTYAGSLVNHCRQMYLCLAVPEDH